MKVTGNIINIEAREIYHGAIEFENGKISKIEAVGGTSNQYILPGFVDAHTHFLSTGLAFQWINLKNLPSLEACRERIRLAIESTPSDQWIIG